MNSLFSRKRKFISRGALSLSTRVPVYERTITRLLVKQRSYASSALKEQNHPRAFIQTCCIKAPTFTIVHRHQQQKLESIYRLPGGKT